MKKFIDSEKLREVLRHYPSVVAAYLIGSVAQNIARKDSDLDIVLLVDEGFKFEDFDSLSFKINSCVFHRNLDLRPVKVKEADPLFLFQVIKGKLLFVRNYSELIALKAKIMKLYYDTQHLRDIFHYYLDKRIEKGEYGR